MCVCDEGKGVRDRSQSSLVLAGMPENRQLESNSPPLKDTLCTRAVRRGQEDHLLLTAVLIQAWCPYVASTSMINGTCCSPGDEHTVLKVKWAAGACCCGGGGRRRATVRTGTCCPATAVT